MAFFVFPANLTSIGVGGKEYKRDPVSGGCEIPVNPEVVAPFGLKIGVPLVEAVVKLPLKGGASPVVGTAPVTPKVVEGNIEPAKKA